jgi:hypothetical protein
VPVWLKKVLGVFDSVVVDEEVLDFLVVDFQKGSFNPELNLIFFLLDHWEYFVDDSWDDACLVFITEGVSRSSHGVRFSAFC